MLLSSEPWGHADHTGITCRCHSDQTGAYVHTVAAACSDPADPRPSLQCSCRIPAAESSPALLQDIADCSPADVAPYLADPSTSDLAPATLWNSADPSPARGFNRQCLTGSAHRSSDVSLSAQGGTLLV